ncbi:MAG: pectate lyase [Prevotellaceae bacterium]|nr:pectate lyase [Prevotellaceae bacterium]MDY5210281.1 pectate lyase [Prevotella sp.]
MTLFLGAFNLSPIQAQDAPAFPGAEGFGRYTTGGRGGKVIHVTNLDDSGTGSLRWALSQSGTKTIVFDVSGYIDLRSQLNVTSNTTIAGQTAPGDGITLRYFTLNFEKCDNVIVRFIRCRRSQVKDVNDSADAAWGRKRKNIILDHCSFSWSIDEVASFYDNRNFTMQWCNVTEGLNAGHNKGDHSYGGIWGGKDASFHHNFIAHVQNRAPRFNGARYNWDGYDKTLYENSIQAERVDFRNCVMYNWGNGNGCYGGPGGGYINMINNYYKAGPGTKNKTRVTQVSVSDASNGGKNPFPGYASRYYINGNYVTAASSPKNYDWQGVIYDSGLYTINGEKYIADPNHYYGENQTYEKNTNGVDCIRLRLDEPIDAGEVTTHNAQTAYEKVLKYCGASYVRDACDLRYAEEAENGTTTFKGAIVKRAGILDVINDPEGTEDPTTASYPTLREEKRPDSFDTDGDGIPDEWETANGLNPSDDSDGNAYTIDTKGYYTNLEVYLNSLVEDIMKGGNADAENAVDEYYPKYNSASGIKGINSSVALTKTTYTTLSGKIISEADAVNGVFIMVEHFADGSKRTRKLVR